MPSRPHTRSGEEETVNLLMKYLRENYKFHILIPLSIDRYYRCPVDLLIFLQINDLQQEQQLKERPNSDLLFTSSVRLPVLANKCAHFNLYDNLIADYLHDNQALLYALLFLLNRSLCDRGGRSSCSVWN